MTKHAEPSVRNLTRILRVSTPDEIQKGLDWYADAHNIASGLAVKYDCTVSAVSGIIAALSPLQGWGENISMAARFLEHGGLRSGYLRRGLVAADSIYRLADPLAVLTGPKVRAFYLSILHAGETDAVCIDRHMWSAAVNTRYSEGTMPRVTERRSRLAQDAVRKAARIWSRETDIQLFPAQAQAIIWTNWRRRFWSEGAFDGYVLPGEDGWTEAF